MPVILIRGLMLLAAGVTVGAGVETGKTVTKTVTEDLDDLKIAAVGVAAYLLFKKVK